MYWLLCLEGHNNMSALDDRHIEKRGNEYDVRLFKEAQPQDLLRPGHFNPLRSREGGVLVRALVIYLNVSKLDPVFLHLVVDDEIHNFSTPDPEKWARWLELLAEIAREVLRSVA